MSRSNLLLLIAFTILIVKGCSSVKQNDYEKDVKIFLNQFEANLSASDEVIMQQFQLIPGSEITEAGVLRAIKIMQNKTQAEDSITCTVNFSGAILTLGESTLQVEITAQFTSVDSAFPFEKSSGFKLFLSSDDKGYFINKIEAQEFYYEYQNAVHELKSRKNRERDIASRKLLFEQAHALQQKYDSVIWFTKYKDSIYYYVVNGEWKNYFIGDDNTQANNTNMGLVSESGRIIVPPAYELVGTVGFESENVVEVKKDGKVGQFNLNGTEIVPAVYEWIIPYQENNEYALVKKDGVIGWLDGTYTYHEGFPSEVARKYIEEFQYLSEKVVISNQSTAMSEIMHVDHMGFGIVMPPVYLVQAGILNEIVPDFYVGENSLGWGGTESFETNGSVFERLSDNFSALMVMITDQYLEGREGFYERTQLTILDIDQKPVAKEVMIKGAVSFNKIDSTLLEVRVAPDEEIPVDGYSEMDNDRWYPPYYKYFDTRNGTLSKLESNRHYAFTQFVKIDSSYLTGIFIYWDEKTETVATENFALESILKMMRNEILASYGYTFTDPEIANNFGHRDWYAPRYKKYEEFYDQMTEIDRYNLEFLEKMIGTLNSSSGA